MELVKAQNLVELSDKLCCVLSLFTAAEVCFNDLGCFDDLPPWGGTAQRPASILPWNKEEIGIRFLLFTQKNRYYQAIFSVLLVEKQLTRSFGVSSLIPCLTTVEIQTDQFKDTFTLFQVCLKTILPSIMALMICISKAISIPC